MQEDRHEPPPPCDCGNSPWHLATCARLGRQRRRPSPPELIAVGVVLAVLVIAAGLVLGYLLSKGLPPVVLLWPGSG